MYIKTLDLNKRFLGCATALVLLPLTSYGITTGSYSPTPTPLNTGMTHADKDTTFDVDTFDEAVGTLTGVTLTLTFNSDTSFTVQNQDPSESQSFKKATATFSPSASLKYPGEPKTTIYDPTTKIGPEKGTLAPGASDYYPGTYTSLTDSFAVPTADFSFFESPLGTTTVPIKIDLLEDTGVSGKGTDIYFGANDCLEATLSVEYLYANCGCDPLPEPSTTSMGLIGLAFSGLFFGRRLWLKRSA